MRRFSTIILLILCSASIVAQERIDNYYQFNVRQHEKGGGDDVFFDSEYMYVAERNGSSMRFTINVYSLETKQKVRTYSPPNQFRDAPGYVIDGGAIFFHTDDEVTKVNMADNSIEWVTEYSSMWSAQIGPVAFENHIGIALDDLILIIDKETGEKFVKIRGEDFDQSLTLTDDFLLYGTFEDGILHVYDLQAKEDRFTLKVGDQLGEGFTQIGEDLVFPSTNVRITCVNGQNGEEKWVWNSDELEGGCGHGFNDAPALIGDELFVNQRETGMYIFNKDDGSFVERIKFKESICTEWLEYNGKIIVVGEGTLFAVDPATREKQVLATYPINDESMPYINHNGRYLALHSIGCYCKPIVRLFDLEELLN